MIAAESLRKPIDPVVFKQELLAQINKARSIVATLPAKDIGCLYIDAKGHVVADPKAKKLDGFSRHYGVVKGSWPRIVK